LTTLSRLKNAQNLSDFAALLGYEPKNFSYIVFKISAEKKYSKFVIPKRGGGTRSIAAPTPKLRLLQSRLSDLLQSCQEEISKYGRASDSFRAKKVVAQGFRRGFSIVSNAKKHRSKKFVLNADIKDFFGSINFGRIRGFFISDKDFALPPAIATLIAQVACFENALPQGSPCSPVLSNLIGGLLDAQLVQLCKRYRLTYSRYADDLTLSSNLDQFPIDIAVLSETSHTWEVGAVLNAVVNKQGFDLNPAKFRVQEYSVRQQVTGLTVNKKVSVPSDQKRIIRAMVHKLLTTGSYEIDHEKTDSLDRLQGHLSFIAFVRRSSLRLEKRDSAKTDVTYQKFLFFEKFYAAMTPIVLCEGKTDNIYLPYAIRALADKFPLLVRREANKLQLNIRRLKYEKKSSSSNVILNLKGGTGDLKAFINDYLRAVKKFSTKPNAPAIIVLDNDDGKRDIANLVKKLKPSVDINNNDNFFHVGSNLYIVLTCLAGNQSQSSIEDYFPQTLLQAKVEGKSFSRMEGKDNSTQYGKFTFATTVVKERAKDEDFAGFEPLLRKITSAIEHFRNLLQPFEEVESG
jgi:RNA-directed DNA polymerase